MHGDEDSFSFLHLLGSVLIVIGGNTQNGYIPEGKRLKTNLNCRGYSIPLTLYAW